MEFNFDQISGKVIGIFFSVLFSMFLGFFKINQWVSQFSSGVAGAVVEGALTSDSDGEKLLEEIRKERKLLSEERKQYEKEKEGQLTEIKTLVEQHTLNMEKENRQEQERIKKRQAELEETQRRIREEQQKQDREKQIERLQKKVLSQIEIEDDYMFREIGGISDASVKITNGSDYYIDKVELEVNYLRRGGQVCQTHHLVKTNLKPKTWYRVTVPNTPVGVGVKMQSKFYYVECASIDLSVKQCWGI